MKVYTTAPLEDPRKARTMDKHCFFCRTVLPQLTVLKMAFQHVPLRAKSFYFFNMKPCVL